MIVIVADRPQIRILYDVQRPHRAAGPPKQIMLHWLAIRGRLNEAPLSTKHWNGARNRRMVPGQPAYHQRRVATAPSLQAMNVMLWHLCPVPGRNP
jgi:hypothetical protein